MFAKHHKMGFMNFVAKLMRTWRCFYVLPDLLKPRCGGGAVDD